MPTDTSPSVTEAPCKVCGYNGPGYYQTATHPCPGNKNFKALPVDETELVERMAGAIHAHLSRRDIMQYLDNPEDCEGLATAALSIVRPHLSEIERLRAQIDEARGVLDDVVNPIRVLQRSAADEGAVLNGNAVTIANDPMFIREIAGKYLRTISGRG